MLKIDKVEKDVSLALNNTIPVKGILGMIFSYSTDGDRYIIKKCKEDVKVWENERHRTYFLNNNEYSDLWKQIFPDTLFLPFDQLNDIFRIHTYTRTRDDTLIDYRKNRKNINKKKFLFLSDESPI